MSASKKSASATKSMSASNEDAALAKKYQQKDELEHVLDRPDMHIGSVEHVHTDMWIYNDDTSASTDADKDAKEHTIIKKNIEYIPGLFKLFDECIINCRDHVVRMNSHISAGKPNCLPVTCISVDIADDGTITMMNDGAGIDVAMHPTLGVWIPELIFGHLRSGTNYDDEKKGDAAALKKKIEDEGKFYGLWGGKNGLGIKLVFIWSTFGSVETVDHVRGLKYYQEFRNNLSDIRQPVVSKCTTKKAYTKITFRPDYARLELPQGLNGDMLALLKKRVYDISAVTDKTVKVKMNGSVIATKNFSQYLDLYIGDKTESARCYESANDRWEYAVAVSPDAEFTQISFVNGIYMQKGGKHVDYIIKQITGKLKEYIEKKKKKTVKESSIKEQLILFVRCDILLPAFDSQSKDYLNTPIAKFGSSCVVSDAFIKKVAEMGVMDLACAISDAKEKTMEKRMDGSKRKRITGIPKLDDANWAGTAKSDQCVLILCEGDSAKAGVISGLSVEDRNRYGVFPLKGKLENIRKPNVTLKETGEIAAIVKILGLKMGKTYADLDAVHNNLRYSKVLIMTDQDLDGSHIKGLCINLFHYKWPSLAKVPGFISFMNTPILKATKGQSQSKQDMVFYNLGEHNAWMQTQTPQQLNAWKIKYYKGLGTSVGKEFKEYFANPKLVGLEHSGAPCDNYIDLMFNKKRADDRKVLLQNYDQSNYLNTSQRSVTYVEFVQKELLGFSCADCVRSIPNVLDGLKPSLRKVLYSCFKRNLKDEIKVAQLAGYISEHSAYHHGEMSLTATIVGMAQNFVGSNNMNLLVPAGQFGTRMKGGGDSASPRYIFTYLESVTKALFVESDNVLLKYLEDDGTSIEPEYYVPVIPTLLANGSLGIGTGYRTNVPCYNPREIFAYLKAYLTASNKANYLLENADKEWMPYYHGFQGKVIQTEPNHFMYKGIYETVGPDTIHISELPVKQWTDDYKEHLEELEQKSVIKTYVSLSTDTTISFTVTFPPGKLHELEHGEVAGNPHCNKLEKLMKLCTTATTTNMVAYNKSQELEYYTVPKIFEEFIPVREALYVERKANMIAVLRKELVKLSNQAKFIRELYADLVDLRKKTPQQVTDMLTTRKYDTVDGDYKYLTRMPMESVTKEHGDAIIRRCEEKQQELDVLEKTSTDQMWASDLDHLEGVYNAYIVERNAASSSVPVDGSGAKAGGQKKKTVAKKAKK